MKPHMEMDPTEGCPIGRDPRTMTRTELEALGHTKAPLLSLIRQNCIECAGHSPAEVRRCGLLACPFWPYRMGSNPFAAPRSEAQMAAARRASALLARKGEKTPKASDISGRTIEGRLGGPA